MKTLKRLKNALVVAAVSALAPVAAFAGGGGGIDYSVITDAVDFGDMSTVVLAVAGALAGIYVIIKGVKIALSFVRGS